MLVKYGLDVNLMTKLMVRSCYVRKLVDNMTRKITLNLGARFLNRASDAFRGLRESRSVMIFRVRNLRSEKLWRTTKTKVNSGKIEKGFDIGDDTSTSKSTATPSLMQGADCSRFIILTRSKLMT